MLNVIIIYAAIGVIWGLWVAICLITHGDDIEITPFDGMYVVIVNTLLWPFLIVIGILEYNSKN